MASKEETALVSCYVPATLRKRVDAYARRCGINRSAAVVLLLSHGLENERIHAIQEVIDRAPDTTQEN